MSAPPLHLAVELDGVPFADLPAAVAAAEATGFALVTLADSPLPPASGERIEAGVLAAYLARRTSRIGLAPALPVTITEPFHLATQLASLDHASAGRAAWVVAAPNGADELATVGRAPLDAAGLRREAEDVIRVARLLWDSWEDDAIIRDVASGRFLDADRVHHVNFEGATFSVAGPLITTRPPQGQVVVIVPHALGLDAFADVVLVEDPSDVVEAGPLVFAEVRSYPARLDDLAGAVHGIRLHPQSLEELTAVITQAPGRPVAGPTLRDTLGLRRPVNTFALQEA
ncbi:LLM class flavin-dependent oxidoreductase [Dactylosporangium sp. AC04546]|uniref:LLM class flavin-dependent oxidoreductase n=1 Tax=Dactylosporangium sp. AC04546 TaxID=2862460 RepID=UPI001EDFC577|nr:LLM class flavin-dependent oxidoreductase [Dactylosporangium sp. AC04546]WVK89197.1 LLM class flavin-dependent oxidoreductase [Dactylosporangium sp. AC04546]